MPKGIAKKTPQRLHTLTATNDLENIRIGKLNGGYVIMLQSQWKEIEAKLERAGFRLNITTERVMHGTAEDDVTQPKTMAAGA